jgi:hypothetical protein
MEPETGGMCEYGIDMVDLELSVLDRAGKEVLDVLVWCDHGSLKCGDVCMLGYTWS